ncbi:hypothetical protein Hanom_Chr06g00509231 [Helianthus anomalus]
MAGKINPTCGWYDIGDSALTDADVLILTVSSVPKNTKSAATYFCFERKMSSILVMWVLSRIGFSIYALIPLKIGNQ